MSIDFEPPTTSMAEPVGRARPAARLDRDVAALLAVRRAVETDLAGPALDRAAGPGCRPDARGGSSAPRRRSGPARRRPAARIRAGPDRVPPVSSNRRTSTSRRSASIRFTPPTTSIVHGIDGVERRSWRPACASRTARPGTGRAPARRARGPAASRRRTAPGRGRSAERPGRSRSSWAPERNVRRAPSDRRAARRARTARSARRGRPRVRCAGAPPRSGSGRPSATGSR